MSHPEAGEERPAELHALLIGVDHYAPSRLREGCAITDLWGCSQDVARIEAVLRGQSFAVPEGRIRKLVSPPLGEEPRPAAEDLPTYRNLVSEIEALGERAAPGDQVLIHFSGHGVQMPAVIAKGPEVGAEDEALIGQYDECLVPCDAGTSQVLRDLELRALIQKLVDRQLEVTVILDSCHSGGMAAGATRSASGVRGLRPWRGPIEPGESAVGSWESLAEGWRNAEARQAERVAAGRPVTRNGSLDSGWMPKLEGLVLLAACRPDQLAREIQVTGGGTSGALTHALVTALGGVTEELTCRRLHDQLLLAIRGLVDHQTPLLEGDGARRFLGRGRVDLLGTASVLEVDRDRRQVVLDLGELHGVRPGAWYRPGRPAGSSEAAGPPPRLQVVEVGPVTSRARIVATGAAEEGEAELAALPEAGERVLLEDPGPNGLVRQVSFEGPEIGGEGLTGAWHDAFERAVEAHGKGFVEVVEAEAEAAFRVRLEVCEPEEGPRPALRAVICDQAGEPKPNVPPLLLGRVGPPPEAVEAESSDEAGERPAPALAGLRRLVTALVHLTRFENVRALSDPEPRWAPGSGLEGSLVLTWFRRPGDDWRQGMELGEPFTGTGVAVDSRMLLRIENTSSAQLFVVLLNLQPTWAIERLFPMAYQPCYPVEARGVLDLPIRLSLPGTLEAGHDLFKVMASTELTHFDCLELPSLADELAGGDRRLTMRSAPRNQLEELFSFLAPVHQQRGSYRASLDMPTAAGGTWTTADIGIEVSRTLPAEA